jgi:hypothetical protein
MNGAIPSLAPNAFMNFPGDNTDEKNQAGNVLTS